MRLSRDHRAFPAVVLLMLVSAWVSRAYCPMTVALSAAQGKTNAHDCCKTGLTGTTPSCCHVDDAANRPATLKSAPTMAAHVPSAFAWSLTLPFQSGAHVRTSNLIPAHSPPLTILRI